MVKLTIRLYVHLEQKVITDLGAINLLAFQRTDGHQACRRWTGICNSTRCRDHAHIEAQRYCSLARTVDTLDVISARSISDQAWMLLNHQDKGGLTL